MSPPVPLVPVAIADTNILINLIRAELAPLLGRTPGLRLVVPDEVLAELTDPAQRALVDAALAEGTIGLESIATPAELAAYVELTRSMGSGESACLALAQSRGFRVACDERRVFLREARARIGEERVMNTPGLMLVWIRAGLLSVESADAAKAVLEANRYKMAFASFRDLLK